MYDYKIEVMMTPIDEEMTSAPYSWCVLYKSPSGIWFNCGHGWAASPQEAWEEAYEYYFDVTTI